MTKPPPVAVIIPAFNGGATLQKAVQSVLEQTWVDFELVVVDDGGDDDLSWIEGLDPRMRLVRQENAGVSAARNTGAMATGAELIAYLDQDDRWLPEKLAVQLHELKPEHAASVTDYYWVFDKREPARHNRDLTRLHLLSGDHFCLSSLLVRRDALTATGGFDTSLLIMQDWDLALKISRSGTIARVDQLLVDYVVHEGNASLDYAQGYRERVQILHREPSGREERRAARVGLRETRRLYGRKAFFTFVKSRSWADLGNALKWSPTTVIEGVLATLKRRVHSGDVA